MTYADQPMLFAGLRPQGSDKKGHCTNDACYRVKESAWEKEKAARKKDQAKKQTAKVKAAKTAGLDVCGCGRIGQADETFKKVGGQKMCPKCLEQEKKRKAGGGESEYQKRSREVAEAKAAFPSTDKQRMAVGLFEYGRKIGETIAESIVGPDFPDELESVVMAMALWVGTPEFNDATTKLMPGPIDAVLRWLRGDADMDEVYGDE